MYFIANTAGRLLIRVFTQKTKLDSYSSSLAIKGPAYLLGLIYGLTQNKYPLTQGVTPFLISLVLLVGVLQIISGSVSVITQKHIDTAPYVVMRVLFVPTSVLISAILLNESLALTEFIGMLIILSGVSIVSTGGKLPHIKNIGRYELLNLSNSVFLGVYVVFSRYIISQTSLPTFMVIFAGIEIIPLILAVGRKSLTRPSKLDLKLSMLIGVASAIHIVAFWLAVDILDNVAIVSSISAFRVVTIFIGSYFVLNEKTNLKQKLVGSLLATAGITLS